MKPSSRMRIVIVRAWIGLSNLSKGAHIFAAIATATVFLFVRLGMDWMDLGPIRSVLPATHGCPVVSMPGQRINGGGKRGFPWQARPRFLTR